MGSPQLENGYIRIAMELVDKFSEYRIPGQEWQILWVILRKTWGWGKKIDRIPLSKFEDLTGIDRRKCHGILSKLANKNIVKKIVPQKGDRSEISYEFNKHYKSWKVSPKRVIPQKGDSGVPQKGDSEAPIPIIVKDTVIDNPPISPPYQKIVSYLNEKTGKKFDYKTKETRGFIKARWNAGFTLDDFKTVIKNKTSKWLIDPKMVDYLRPQTLFGTKFEAYLQERPNPLQGRVSEKSLKNIEALNAWEQEENEKQDQV